MKLLLGHEDTKKGCHGNMKGLQHQQKTMKKNLKAEIMLQRLCIEKCILRKSVAQKMGKSELFYPFQNTQPAQIFLPFASTQSYAKIKARCRWELTAWSCSTLLCRAWTLLFSRWILELMWSSLRLCCCSRRLHSTCTASSFSASHFLRSWATAARTWQEPQTSEEVLKGTGYFG